MNLTDNQSYVDNVATDLVNQTDEVLLQKFVHAEDHAALQQLLEKHSTLVMSVCQQVLRNRHDAEEAFQETFLKLVNRACTIQKQSSLSSWLYRVAHREAIQIVRRQHRKQTEKVSEEPVVPAEQSTTPEFDELSILHEELNELSEKYRAPLVLCYLEGKSQREAATELKVTLASVKASLASGREKLQRRLLQRGVAFTAVMAAWQSAQAASTDLVTTAMIQKTLAGCLTNAATTTSIPSLTLFQTISTKGMMWMAISNSNKALISGVVALLLLAGGGTLSMLILNQSGSEETIVTTTSDSSPSQAETIIWAYNSPSPIGDIKTRTRQQLKEFGLQFHQYHDIFGHFPYAISYNSDGKIPHNWRVELLPIILGSEGLKSEMTKADYDYMILECGYDIEQPWDSPDNAEILKQMPEAYRIPTDTPETNSSVYQALTGTKTDEKISGSSQLLVVPMPNNEPWTKPAAVEFPGIDALINEGGNFYGLMEDGAVRLFSPPSQTNSPAGQKN